METFSYIINKYNINPKSGYIIDIPNMNREDLAKLFAERNYAEGVEVGVEKGIYSEILCKANPSLHLTCIDPWSALSYEPNIHGVDEEQKKYDDRYAETQNRLAPYNTDIIRKTSMQAINEFPDESIDFVYIDANHDFLNFTMDLHYWKQKVRKGGIVAGHDYAVFSFKKHNHVKRVLEAYARSYRMIPIFVVGSMEYKEGQKRDQFRSWFWVKQ